MRILIDDKPVDGLTAKRERSLMLGKVQDSVKGTVLTPAEATETYIRQTRRWFKILGGIAFVLMAAIAIAGISSDPREGAFIAVGALVVGGALLLFMVLLLRHRVRNWNRKIAHRVDGLAPPGTAIRLDASGLSIGVEVFAWPSLAIESVEFTSGSLPSGDTSTNIMLIERLSLTAGPKAIALDRAMMQNGILLVDNCWRRLHAAPD
ncbi:MAG: hypothetical protein E6G95_05590 [Alphaproteobacteria bacterium]|nr:MAG: hypothetical protein E6G95_05590 [Alphaproteobacteria bacterium]